MSKQNRDKRARDKRAKARVRGLAAAKKAKDKKAKSKKVAPKPPEFNQAKTPNGQRLQELCLRAGWNPNQYKDVVAIVGTRLIDWKDSYNVTDTNGKMISDGSHVMLVHKRELHGMIPDKMADMFWHKRTQTRVVKGGPSGPVPVRVSAKVAPARPSKPPKDEDKTDVDVCDVEGG